MASIESPERYRFGAFELQLDERRLLKDGQPVVLTIDARFWVERVAGRFTGQFTTLTFSNAVGRSHGATNHALYAFFQAQC